MINFHYLFYLKTLDIIILKILFVFLSLFSLESFENPHFYMIGILLKNLKHFYLIISRMHISHSLRTWMEHTWHVRNMLGTCSKHLRNMLGTYSEHARNMLGTNSEHAMKILETCSEHVYNMLGTCSEHYDEYEILLFL